MSPFKVLCILLLFTVCLCLQKYPPETTYDTYDPSPLILVPGDGGSRAYSDFKIGSGSFRTLAWVNFIYMVFPGLLRILFRLEYDPQTHKTRNTKRSNVVFPGWGSTDTIEELDDSLHKRTSYFSKLVKELTKDKFYERNKTLRGAPYDFRKAPNENENFTTDMKKLIEDTYKNSGNQRVVILGHSMGSLYTLFFLKRMSISWKKQYIRAFVSVSGPFAGAVKALSLETSGASLGSPRSPKLFREMERSFPSTAFLLPRPEIYGRFPLVITPKRNYSAYDYKELFNDMRMPYGIMMYNDTKDLVNGSESPEGVNEIYCIHSNGLNTIKQMIFKSFPNKKPKIINGDGDNTVNIESLEICKNWKNVQYTVIPKLDHMNIVGEPKFLEKLKQILYKQPNTMFEIEPLESTNSDDNLNRLF